MAKKADIFLDIDLQNIQEKYGLTLKEFTKMRKIFPEIKHKYDNSTVITRYKSGIPSQKKVIKMQGKKGLTIVEIIKMMKLYLQLKDDKIGVIIA